MWISPFTDMTKYVKQTLSNKICQTNFVFFVFLCFKKVNYIIRLHQYFHFNCSHPDQTKRSITYSHGLRLTKICTFENDFLQHRDEMRSWFQRHYPEDVINNEMKKVVFTGNFGKSSNKNKGVC